MKVLAKYEISTITELEAALKDQTVKPMPLSVSEATSGLEKVPMDNLQYTLTKLIAKLSDTYEDVVREYFGDKDKVTMGDCRFYVVKQCNVWKYDYRSTKEMYREDALKQIAWLNDFFASREGTSATSFGG